VETQAVTAKSLLIVEDDDVAREALTALLDQHGYRTTAYPDGRQGLDYLRAGGRPDAILLDMLMPVLDGWRFLEELQKWSEPLSVPVIVTTGTILTREWARQKGCAGFVRKPIDPDMLIAELNHCIG
jgi:CheY-like chemotaxis protein